MARHAERSPQIGAHTYKVKQLGAVKGLELLTQLSKIALPGLGGLLGAAGKGGLQALLESEVGAQGFRDLATQLAGQLNVDQVRDMALTLSECTDVFGPGYGDAGAPLDVQFDDHFAGRYGELVQWLAFALRVNYGSFLDGLMSGGIIESASQEPPAAE